MISQDLMQATLVSFYGNKPKELEKFILACQKRIIEIIGTSFLPYELEQVHGTIIGLEGYRFADKIQNASFETNLSQRRMVDPAVFLEFIRQADIDTINIKIGGYSPEFKEFTSRDQLPYKRSFSIQNNIVTLMGWPTVVPDGCRLLDKYRRSFNKVNVLHKWHRTLDEVDDDFYLVLGRVKQIKEEEKECLVEMMQLYLSTQVTVNVALERNCLSVVGYIDPQLPISSSCALSIIDKRLTPSYLLDLYSE